MTFPFYTWDAPVVRADGMEIGIAVSCSGEHPSKVEYLVELDEGARIYGWEYI